MQLIPVRVRVRLDRAAQGLGLSYKDFVVPAVIIQTLTFTGRAVRIGIGDDMNTGMIDRFRSLPIARVVPPRPHRE
jgi:hypothetical protein